MGVGGRDRAGVAVAVAVVTTLLQVGLASGAFGIPEFLVFGDCTPIKPQQDLHLDWYSGIWFTIEMVPNDYADIKSCSMTNYTWENDPHDPLMLVEERGLDDHGGKLRQHTLMYPTEGQPGVMTVEAEGVPSAPYVVVDTDYDSYSCVHSCFAMMGFRAAFSWVLSRRPALDPALVTRCRTTLEGLNIDTSTMLPVTQGKECPYTHKLEAVLGYSAKVQARARAKAKGKTDTTARGVQTLADHRHQEAKDGPLEEEEEVEFRLQDAEPTRLRSEVVSERHHQHHTEEEAMMSGCEATTHDKGLLLLLLMAAILILVTSPPSFLT